MKYSVKVPHKGTVTFEDNFLDRAIKVVSPQRYAQRLRGRLVGAIAGNYFGASKTRRQTSQWLPIDGDPDVTITYELSDLRSRSRDMQRNTPIAAGAINTAVTNVVGAGLTLQARIDRSVLNLTDEQADAWERAAEREWALFSDTKECDLARTLKFSAITELAFRQVLENGDIFINLPRIPRGFTPYQLRLQLIEADRVSNKDGVSDTKELVMGVHKDANGAPFAYDICNQFPWYNTQDKTAREWQTIKAWGEQTGLPNILHLFRPLRPGQSRGIPYLTPVIEPLKQLDRYTESELMAAVISSMFTVFIETEKGTSDFDIGDLGAETGATTSDKDVKLASGAIIDLAKGEKITTANPGRPNSAFDPFVIAILRQIGVALEIPYEILIKHFTASYSASRAALLEAWKFFITRRTWLSDNFCQPVYEVFLYEAITSGRLSAPGFFKFPEIRRAYTSAEWIGPAQGQLDPVKETNAAGKRLELRISTISKETAALGGDWDRNFPQIRKETEQLRSIGLTPPAEGPKPAAQPETPPDSKDTEDQKEDALETA